MTAPTVAFLGTGIMGKPMVRNLLRAGYAVHAWNRSADKAAELAAEGARLGASLADTAAANPEFAKYNFTYIYAAEAGALSIYQKGDPRVDIITGLGLKEDTTLAALPKSAGTFVSTIGLEKADLLKNTDVLFTWFNDEANEKEIEKQKLFSTIPAVERGSYVANVNQQLAMASTVITPLSLPYALDRYVGMIKAAAAKVD